MPSVLTPCPKPGLYPKVKESVYRLWNAINISALKEGELSMEHAHHALHHPKDPTDPMNLGTAYHAAVLQPDRFDELVGVAPEGDRRTKEVKALYEAFCIASAGKTIISAKQHEDMKRMVDATMSNKAARNMIEAARENQSVEIAAVWNDRETGVLCKARVDGFIPETLQFDLKTTDNAHPEEFAKSIFDFGYHIQQCQYADGFCSAAEAMGAGRMVLTNPVLIAQENKGLFKCVVYPRLDDETMAIAKEVCRRLLREWMHCEKRGVWPGYAEIGPEIGIPAWKRPRRGA